MALSVLLEPAPAMTGTLPRACSTVMRITASVSSAAEGGAFARGAHRDQAVDALLDLEVDQAPQGRFVELPVLRERGHQGREDPLVHALLLV